MQTVGVELCVKNINIPDSTDSVVSIGEPVVGLYIPGCEAHDFRTKGILLEEKKTVKNMGLWERWYPLDLIHMVRGETVLSLSKSRLNPVKTLNINY